MDIRELAKLSCSAIPDNNIIPEAGIIIKNNIFDYKDNCKEVALQTNSFVADLETYHNIKNNVNPIITIFAYAQLSYLVKKDSKMCKQEARFINEFKPNVLDIMNDADKSKTKEEREVELFEKMLEDMIQTTKNSSDSANKKITIYFFNCSGYDNSYLIKLLTRMNYKQTLNDNIQKVILNDDELKPIRNRIIEYNEYLDKNWSNLSGEETENILNEINLLKKKLKRTARYSSYYEKEYYLLSNDSVKQLSLRFGYKNYEFHIKDIWCFHRTSLANLGKIVGFKKEKDIGNKYYDREPESLSLEEWNEYKYYAGVDIKILWEVIKKFSNLISYDNDNILTISSMSIYNWKHFEKENARFLKIPFEEWKIGNQSYRGGFSFVNEKFLNKKVHNVHSYDINSSYPSSMKELIPYIEIDKSEYDEEVKTNKIVKLLNIRFINFKLRDDMIPIIPNSSKNINNSYYKDYNIEKANQVFKWEHPNNPEEWTEFCIWVWEEELEWFKKFYNDLEYDILETKYFKCKKLFDNYINHYYITKAQSDVDMVICYLLDNYINNRDLKWVETKKKERFDYYFNSKNNLLIKDIDSYWKDLTRVLDSNIKLIDNMNENELKEYKEDLKNQMLYLETTRATTKLYLNTLYGKFGMKPVSESHIITDIELERGSEFETVVDKTTMEKRKFSVVAVKNHHILDKNVYSVIRTDKPKTKANNVYIASYITMLSRMKLYRAIYKYKNHSVLYGDTDSIKMFDIMDDEEINNVALGKWKYEGTYETFAYIGAKKYIYRDLDNDFKLKIAGVNGLTKKYKGYENNKEIQDKIIEEFISFNLETTKKNSSVNKETGEKMVLNSASAVKLIQKDKDIQFLSIDKKYNDLYEKHKKDKVVESVNLADLILGRKLS